MKSVFLIIILASAFPVKAITKSEDKNIAPRQSYKLIIDGVPHEITTNSLEEIQIEENKHSIKLVKNKTRVFNHAGVTFEFNSEFNFSYEEIATGFDFWSLDGNDAVIMVQEMLDKRGFDEILEAFTSQYTQMKANIKVSETELVVDNKITKGKKLDINLGDVRLEQLIFYFSKNQSSIVLILQDSLSNSGENSDEFKKMKKLIQTTLSVSI